MTYGRTRTNAGVLVFSLIAGLALAAVAESRQVVEKPAIAAVSELPSAERAQQTTLDEHVRAPSR